MMSGPHKEGVLVQGQSDLFPKYLIDSWWKKLPGLGRHFMARSSDASSVAEGGVGLKTLATRRKPERGCCDEDGAHCRSCPLSGPRTVAAVAVDGPAVVDSVPGDEDSLLRENLRCRRSSPIGRPPRSTDRGV